MNEPIRNEAFEASCSLCRFFRGTDALGGACHRYPPAYAGDSSPRETHHWRYPTVSGRGWCGEHQPKAGI